MRFRWEMVALVYGLIGLIGAGLARLIHHTELWSHPSPYLQTAPLMREALSAGLGLGFALLVVGSTRLMVKHFSWAQQLHKELRPVAAGLSVPAMAMLALFSSVSEEMLFRAFLTPLVGVFVQALIFGLAHQMPGPSRWVWVLWAAGVGLALGGLYWFVGSLTGPIVAHALINTINLAYLRDHIAAPKEHRLGGLLGSGS